VAIDDQQLLTVKEVAERLRLHPITVRRLIASGRLSAVRIGRAVRVRDRDVGNVDKGESHSEVKQQGDWPLPDAETKRLRKIVQDMRRERGRMRPLEMSTEQLVHEARKELEDRYRIPPGLDRRRIRRR
jgi:excisionase family DNA binding protein